MKKLILLVSVLLLLGFNYGYSSNFAIGKYKFKKRGFDGGMEITKLNQKKFDFHIDTVDLRSLNSCLVEGTAKVVAENKAIFKEQELTDIIKDCVIEFLAKENGIEVRAKGEDCYKYCGLGGVFEGLYVKVPVKKKK
jgi:hypothetical protein